MELDELFEESAILIYQHDSGSTSLLQRKLKLGYQRANKIMEQLEAHKIVGPFNSAKPRDVLFKNHYNEMIAHIKMIKP